jgi:ABC-type dipeptide/oligopeptide/nickel transport system ATPase subunit
VATIQTERLMKGCGRDVYVINDLSLISKTGEVFGFLDSSCTGKSKTNDILPDYHSQPAAGPSAV